MSREAFHQLLQRYLDGNCSSEEKRIVEQWYGMLDKRDLPEVSDRTIGEIEQRLWEKVRPESGQLLPVQKNIRPGRLLWTKVAVAASIAAMVLAIGFYAVSQLKEPAFLSENKTQVSKFVNTANRSVPVLLEDGSRVMLGAGAELIYPVHFSKNRREVFLKGEAFFEVSKNPDRPFLVFNRDVVVRVVGTSFTVKPASNKTEVSVRTGKVIVTDKAESASLSTVIFHKNRVALTPNQKATFDTNNGELQASLVEKPVMLVTGKNVAGSFLFNEAPLAVVLERLEKVYGVAIRTENEEIKHCTFTGDLSGQDLYTQLEFICQSIRASYTLKGVTIEIKGKGCI